MMNVEHLAPSEIKETFKIMGAHQKAQKPDFQGQQWSNQDQKK